MTTAVERGVLQGLAAFRWAAWAWMAATLTIGRDRLERPTVGIALVVLALAFTVAATVLWRATPEALLRPGPVAAELAIGAALILLDGVVREPGAAFSTGQSIGSVWPLVGVLAAGVASGPTFGGMAGLALGAARVGSTILNDVGDYDGARVLSLANSAVFYALAGAVAGYVFRLISRAEREVAEARAREEVARTLHDGVLQTLALVERRTEDVKLARLAREQERDLREFLFGSRSADVDLGAALRRAAARFEDNFGGRTQVLIADDLPPLDLSVVRAVAGAVTEALNNAGRHGEASRVTVFVEPAEEGRLFCSVKDDGRGFDTASAIEGDGVTRSIRGRIADVRGEVDITSAPGRGTEVRMWVP